MKTLTAFLHKFKLRQIVIVFLAGLLLIVSTACNSGNEVGARPENPPVQAGGQNNPYQGGGDNNTSLKTSTDSKVINKQTNSRREQASLQFNSQLLIATNKESELLYPGAETPEGKAYKESELPIITEKNIEQPQPGGSIQREPDLGTRVKERLGTVKEAFGEAAEFLNDKADEAGARPELKANPAAQ